MTPYVMTCQVIASTTLQILIARGNSKESLSLHLSNYVAGLSLCFFAESMFIIL